MTFNQKQSRSALLDEDTPPLKSSRPEEFSLGSHPTKRHMHPMLHTHREELVRLMLQTLNSLGLKRTAETLQEESGVSLQTEAVACFREQVLEGKWQLAQELIPALGIDPVASPVTYLILRQQFLELLEERNTMSAINLLRTKITPIAPSQQELHKLAALVMCKDFTELSAKAPIPGGWDGKLGTSRSLLLRQLHTYIHSTVLLQEDRLPILFSQALEAQVRRCMYHNVAMEHSSLLSDHVCTIDTVPQHTVAILADHTDEVWYVTFSPNGRYLASCSKDMTCNIYDISLDPPFSPLLIGKCLGHTQAVFQCVFDPKSECILTCSADNTVMRWTLKGLEEKRYVGHAEGVNAIAWLPDGASFVSASDDKFMIRWDTATGAILQRWHGSRAYDLAITRDGKCLVTVDSEKRLCKHSLLHGDYVQAIHPIPATTTNTIAAATVASLSRGRGDPDPPNDLDNDSLNERSDDDAPDTRAQPEPGHEPSIVRETENMTSLYLSEDGNYCLVNVSLHEQVKGVIVLYDLRTGKPIQKYIGQRQTKYVIRSCLGGALQNFVLSGSEDCKVAIYHRVSGKRLLSLRGHTKIVSSVTWNPVRHHLLASASDDKTVRLWGTTKPPSTDPASI